MRFSVLFVLAIAVVAAIAVGARSEEPATPKAAERDQIRELLQVTGSGAVGEQVFQTMMTSIRAAFPQVPAEVWDEFTESLNEDDLNEMVVGIYERHLTHDEVAAMLTFYKTEEGRAIIRKLPIVMQESMQVGQRWGEDKMREIVQQLQARGYKPRQI